MEVEIFEKILLQLDRNGQLFYGYELSLDNDRPKMLGMGGFSYVYEMVDKDNPQNTYALKVFGISKHNITPDQFFDTVRIQKLLMNQTEYVVALIDNTELTIEVSGYGPVKLYFVLMEKVCEIIHKDKFKNVSLLRDELFEEKNVIKFAFEVGKTLSEAHENKILHRDIKLENIFWDEERECYKVGDFGVSRFIEEGFALTQVMTSGYGAPEVEKPDVDGYNETSDIYSFGITLYLLLNDLKFPGSTGYFSHPVQYTPEFNFPAPVNASPGMSRIINKMCQYYCEDRYQSVAEVLADISLLADEEDEGYDCENLPDIATVTFRENLEARIKRIPFISKRAERKRNEQERKKQNKKTTFRFTVLMTLLSLFIIAGFDNCLPMVVIAVISVKPAVMVSSGASAMIWLLLEHWDWTKWLDWVGNWTLGLLIIPIYLFVRFLYWILLYDDEVDEDVRMDEEVN